MGFSQKEKALLDINVPRAGSLPGHPDHLDHRNYLRLQKDSNQEAQEHFLSEENLVFRLHETQ